MADKNYYDLLGVQKTATEQEIKSAYRKAVMQYHPDRFATKPEAERKQAEEKFKEINHAYDVLSDPQKKANYDQYGTEDGPQFSGGFGGGSGGGFSGFGGFEDIFSQFFGGGGRTNRANMPIDGEDITMRLDITFEEAIHGAEKSVKVYRTEKCPDCKGSGASDPSKITTCPDCNGTGNVTITQNTIFGRQTVRTKCSRCGGTGKIITEKCKTCRGAGTIKKERVIPVTIPAGIDNGQTISYYNEGEVGINGGQNGRLIIVINVKPHPLFVREGYDLYYKVPISLSEAINGTKLEIPTVDSSVTITIPAGTQTNTKFRVKGYGVKYLKKQVNGDLYVTVEVETPQKLSKKQQDLLKAFEDSLIDKQYEKRKSFRTKWLDEK